MKWILIIMTIVLPAFRHPGASIMTWAVDKETSVKILGASNVNSFTFASRGYEEKDTLIVYQTAKTKKVTFLKGLLRLPVKNFKNGNPMLTRDFKKMLEAQQHPYILMNLKSLTTMADQPSKNQPVEAEIEITISGKSKTRQVCLLATRSGDMVYFHGKERINFSDFDLQPPTKVLGFINVKNELQIEFNLALKVLRHIDQSNLILNE
ncbi:MAG TPA: YceI family protein [Chitinophagaceae bacterium]